MRTGKTNSGYVTLAVCAAVLLLAGATPAAAQVNGTTLTATKTAEGHDVRTYDWTIAKSAAPSSWSLFTSDSGTTSYTVSVTKRGYTDSARADGQICITNGGAIATANLAVADEVMYNAGGGTGFLTLTTSPVDLSAMPVLAPGQSYCYNYAFTFTPVPGADYKNVAHITITNHSAHLGEPFGPNPAAGFSLPSTPDVFVNGTIHVSDSNGGGGPWEFSDSGSVSYGRTFACDGDQGSHNNTATIVETGQSASASVKVGCYALLVAKTARTSFTRTYDWTIAKGADQSSLTLATGESFVVNYAVTLNGAYADSNWAAQGAISVSNPAPIPATINSVTDIISPSIGASVSCGVGFPYLLPATSTLTCSYASALPDAAARINTGTAVQQNFSYGAGGSATPTGTTSYSGTAAVDFSSAAVTSVDQCIAVTDTAQGTLGTVCYGSDALPKSYTYSRTIGPYSTCGGAEVPNTASYTGSDTGKTGSAQQNVKVTVPCVIGCTLTQGYWKTHSSYGPAPYDDAWGLIGEDTPFYSSGKGWYKLLWTPPQGGNAYIILGDQFIAAKLNLLNGAASTPAVDSALTWANTFFMTYTPTSKLSNSVRNMALAYAALLDQYNNGLALGGPGHCSQ